MCSIEPNLTTPICFWLLNLVSTAVELDRLVRGFTPNKEWHQIFEILTLHGVFLDEDERYWFKIAGALKYSLKL